MAWLLMVQYDVIIKASSCVINRKFIHPNWSLRMRNPSKSFPLGLRIVTFMLGAIFLFWLPIENDRIWMPTMIAFAISLLWAFWINISRTIRTVKDIVWQMWIGIFSALTVTPHDCVVNFLQKWIT